MRLALAKGRLLAAATALLIANGAAQAADVNIAGDWKIAAPQTSFTVEGGGKVPFTAAGAKAYAENKRLRAKKQFIDYDPAVARCSSPGTPRMLLMPGVIRIFQRPDMVFFAFQWNRVLRMIPLPGYPAQVRDPGGAQQELVGSNEGTAAGRWEGDTLVITTTNFSTTTLIDDLVPHGDALKVTERIRLKDGNTLEDRITIEDPEYFTRPWTTVVSFTRQAPTVLKENVCLDKLMGPPPLPTK